MESQQVTLLVLLDLSTALDTVRESQYSPGTHTFQLWCHWYRAGVAPILFVQPLTACALGGCTSWQVRPLPGRDSRVLHRALVIYLVHKQVLRDHQYSFTGSPLLRGRYTQLYVSFPPDSFSSSEMALFGLKLYLWGRGIITYHVDWIR